MISLASPLERSSGVVVMSRTRVRAQAVQGMGRGGREQEFLEILAARLKDPEDSVKKAVMTAIIRLDQNGLDELIDEAIEANPHLKEDWQFKSAKKRLERARQFKEKLAQRRNWKGRENESEE